MIKNGNTLIIQDDNFSDASIVKSDTLDFEILNRNGLPTRLKKALVEAEKAKVELEKFNIITFSETEIESYFTITVNI
jgi:hypothetical protein